MVCSGATIADLVSWDPDLTAIFELPFSQELWGKMQSWLLKWKDSIQPLEPCDETREVLKLAGELAEQASKTRKLVVSVRVPDQKT